MTITHIFASTQILLALALCSCTPTSKRTSSSVDSLAVTFDSSGRITEIAPLGDSSASRVTPDTTSKPHVIHNTRADELFAAGRFADALKAYQKMPEDAYVLKQVGICQLRTWNLPAAILAFKRSRTLDPSDDDVTGYLAEALTYNKNFDDALILYREYLQRNPSNTSARISYARTLSWVKDYSTARDQYVEVLKRDSGRVEARIGLADVLMWQKDFEKALGEYTHVLTSTASKNLRSDANQKMGDILSWQAKYPEAIKRYQTSIGLNATNTAALFGLGQVYEWTGEFPKAKASYAQILQTDPGNKQARAKLQALLWVK